MATARPKKAPPKPVKETKPIESAKDPWIFRAFDAVFRFLASLKLAVISLTTLAAVLAYGTVYETTNGPQAVAIDIYQSKWFALLLAMLGVNILCAALIRFPWKKRQTGFVITHAGLITVLIGSFLSIKMTDEGELYIDEGKSSHQYVRENYPVINVEPVNPETGASLGSPFVLPFRPGAAPWESEQRAVLARNPAYEANRLALKGVVAAIGILLIGFAVLMSWRWAQWVNRPLGAVVLALCALSGILALANAWTIPVGPRRDLLTEPSDPFRLVVKDYFPAATRPHLKYGPAADGVPMIRAALLFKPPQAEVETDSWDGEGWIVTTPMLKHGARSEEPLDFHYQVLDGPRGAEALADFLDVPANPLSDHRVRFHYTDKNRQPRVYDWILSAEESQILAAPKAGGERTLPDSDIVASFQGLSRFPTGGGRAIEAISPGFARLMEEIGEATQSSAIIVATFKVKSGDAPSETYFGWAGLPLAPNVLRDSGEMAAGNVRIDYYHPPELARQGDTTMTGRRAVVEVVQAPDRRLHYRIIGRDGLKGLGTLKVGERVQAFGGKNMPMQVAIRVDEVLSSGRGREVCELDKTIPAKLMRDIASPAALVELTADGVTQEAWLYHAKQRGAFPKYLETRNGLYKLTLDYERRDLGFDVNLIDFEAQFDPGSTSRSTFRSDVTVRELNGSSPAPVAFAELGDNKYFQFVERPRETFRKLTARTYEPFDGGEVITIDQPTSMVQPSDTPTKIYMNNPMQREGWTFFQSSFRPVIDPRTRQESGEMTTVLSIRYDPAWPIIYGGCVLVVIGTFVQFYMRSGVFTDGGKRERARANRAAAAPTETTEPDMDL